MAQGNKITNTVLAIVALLLLWICVRSIFTPAPADGKKPPRRLRQPNIVI